MHGNSPADQENAPVGPNMKMSIVLKVFPAAVAFVSTVITVGYYGVQQYQDGRDLEGNMKIKAASSTFLITSTATTKRPFPLSTSTALPETTTEKELWCLSRGPAICRTDGWLVWLRRRDNSVTFKRTWSQYLTQFGDKSGNFWLGLSALHRLTGTGTTFSVRVELTSWKGSKSWAEYRKFSVASQKDKYRLTLKDYNKKSTAPDKMGFSSSAQFSTIDRDSTNTAGTTQFNPAKQRGGGGWWINPGRAFVNPTARIELPDENSYGWKPVMFWYDAFEGNIYQPLKNLTMMVRPTKLFQ